MAKDPSLPGMLNRAIAMSIEVSQIIDEWFPDAMPDVRHKAMQVCFTAMGVERERAMTRLRKRSEETVYSEYDGAVHRGMDMAADELLEASHWEPE